MFWIRQVIVPGIMDNEEYMKSLLYFLNKINNIEKIEFWVLTNESSSEQMTISFSVSNLAKETNISSIDTFNEIKAHTPEAFKAQKYTFAIGQTVASGTGSTISIDISESSELLLNKNNPESNFKWMIYGLKVYGEHREYSK